MGTPTDRGAEPGGVQDRRPVSPTRREILAGITSELRQAGLESPHVEAERLIATALSISRSDLTVGAAERVAGPEAVQVARAVARRLEGEPLQHIEGSVAFRRLVLVSDGRALIPRPETEQLVELVARRVATEGPARRALEVGVGSGAVALSLIAENLADLVVGLDVSERALGQARQNAERADLAARLELRRCPVEIWPAVSGEARFDLLVANLPYIATDEVDRLQTEVRDHEPRVALDGGPDGLDVIRTLIEGAPDALVPGARIFLEIGADQGPAVRALFDEGGRWEEVRIEPDLAGRPRFATARLGGLEAPES